MENSSSHKISKIVIIRIAVALILLSLCAFGGYRYFVLHEESVMLKSDKTNLQSSLQNLSVNFSKLKGENSDLKESLNAQTERVGDLASQVGNISGTVGTLKKLSETDSELLKKYSKVAFLNENYIPTSLTPINSQYLYDKSRTLTFLTPIESHLESLLSDATSAGNPLQIISAYRSFGTQSVLKSSYTVTYGAGTANSFSADQGYSEHQLGTAVDFTTSTVKASFSGFSKTAQYTWLLNNAHKYGFIISYPANNTYYEFEPWHWRYVGVALATYIHNQNKYFYDVDQRTIDEYLISFFD